MIFALLAAVALGVVPKPIAATAHFFESDYPIDELRNHQTGLTRAEVVIGPDGVVLRCDLIGSSGSRALDRKACLLARGRFKYEPAKDETGMPITGVYRLDLTWAITDVSFRYATWTDMTLSVDHLPPLAKLPLTKLRIVLDISGHIDSCEIDESSGSNQLDRLACSAAAKAKLIPTNDAAGAPVRAIRTLVVAYTDKPVTPDRR